MSRDDRECNVRLTAQVAFELRYILPLVNEALGAEAGPEAASTQAMLDQAVAALHEALPPDLRCIVNEREIAERRMDAIDAQRAAGVRGSGKECRCIQTIQGCPVHDPTQPDRGER